MANVDALDVAQLQIEKRNLHVPTLGELRQVLAEGLSENFTESSVEIVDCPDLTKNPFTLAAPGLGGKATILEVGGPPFLLPTVQRNKLYNIRTLLNHLKYGEESFIVGAGAGPWPHLNSNCEMMMNLHLSPNQIKNNTHLASVNQQNGKCVLHDLPNDELRFALLANLYVSEGKPGKVLKVYAKKRTGNNDFIASMQKSIAKHYKDHLVGLGGTFIMNEGKIKQHVMPDFSPVPLNSLKELDGWLKFYDMSTPLIAVGTFVSAETDLDLRVQHFHSFSQHGEGGHYHIDTTPESIEYLGYFNVGDVLYRIDKPPHTLQFGKD